MSKAAPWSIKGIDYDVRIAAKEAAKRSGMTLGEWLNSVISEQASEMGLDPDDLDEEDRQQAISSRLEQMARQERRYSRRTDRPHAAPSRGGYAYEQDDFEPEHRAPPRRFQHREVRYGEFDRESRGPGAEDLYERLARIEAAVGQRSGGMDDKTVRRALSRIEARMEALAENVGHEDEHASDLDRKMAEIAARLNAPVRPAQGHAVAGQSAGQSAGAAHEAPAVKMVIDNSMRSQLERMAGGAGDTQNAAAMRPSELARIEAKLNLLLSRDAPAAQAAAGMAFGAQSSRSPVSDAVAEIHMRQKALDGGGRMPAATPSNAAHQAVASVRNDLRAVASRLEALKHDTRGSPIAAQATDATAAPAYPGLEQLRVQMDEVNRAVANLAPKNSISSLESAVRELGERVANSRQEGVRESILEPIETLIRDLQKSLHAQVSSPQLNAMEKELQDISRRLGHAGNGGDQLDTSRIDEIYQQTSSIRDLLTAAVARPMPVEAIEKQISALGKRIDAIAARGSSPVGIAAVTENVEEIRAAMRDAYPADELATIQERIETLSRKFDLAMANLPAIQNIDDMSQRIDAVQRTIFQRLERPSDEAAQTSRKLEGLMREIRDRLDITTRSERASDTSVLEEQIKTLSEKFDASQKVIDTKHLSALEQHLRALVDKLDGGGNVPEQPVLTALENQVSAIARRLDTLDLPGSPTPGATLDILENIEQNVAGLLNQLEDTRLTAADAAETAARNATQHALEDLLKNGVLTGGQSEHARELIAREIANLRSSQDATDRRTHATLSAVHETLEKVVDRLALLEDNIETVQAPVAPTASATPAQNDARETQTFASGPAPLFQRQPATQASPRDETEPDDWDVAIARTKAQANAKSAEATKQAPPVLPPNLDNVLKQTSTSSPAGGGAGGVASEAKAFTGDRKSAAAPQSSVDLSDLKIDPDASALWMDADEDELLEPGSGAPGQGSPGKSGHEDRLTDAPGAKASTSFIAAARRASMAAQAEAEAASAQQSKRRKGGDSKDSAFAEARARAAAAASLLSSTLERKNKDATESGDEPEARPAKAASARSALRSRKVLLSLGLAAAVLVLGTLQFMRMSGESHVPAAPKASPAKPAVNAKPPAPLNPQRGATLQNGFSATGSAMLPSDRFAQPRSVDSQPVATISGSGSPQAPAKTAITNLFEAAADGQAAAQYELAVRHIDGRAVSKDMKRAIELLKRAADQGLAPAQYRLASIYEKGTGAEKKPKEALGLYEAAAKAGNVRAMHNLAVLAADGSAGKSDYATAAKWFLSAAEHDVRDSQYNLAILYARGLGIPRNLVESYKWFDVAARKGDTDAASKRDQVARRLSPGELTQAREIAQKFRPRKAPEVANSVTPPQGGWSLQAPRASAPGTGAAPVRPQQDSKNRNRPKMSAL